MSNKRIIRAALQILVLGIVAAGIFHSGKKAALQLTSQREQLAAQAEELERSAANATDEAERRSLQQQSDRLRSAVNRFWQASPSQLLLCAACYAVGLLPANWYWRQCLLAMDQRAPWLATSWAYFFGNLGKYFPGKAMVIILRLGALAQYQFKKMATAITIFMETLTMMAVGGALASICLIILNLDWRLTLLAVGLLICTFLPTMPPILRIVICKLQRGVPAETLGQWTSRIHTGLILKGWFAMAITWLFWGLSLQCVLNGLPIAETSDATGTQLLLSSLGACALAVVLGFVSLLPGGAGVREVVLSTILAPVVGPAAALCSALWLRVVWLATELAMVAVLAVARFFSRRRAAPTDHTPTSTNEVPST